MLNFSVLDILLFNFTHRDGTLLRLFKIKKKNKTHEIGNFKNNHFDSFSSTDFSYQIETSGRFYCQV